MTLYYYNLSATSIFILLIVFIYEFIDCYSLSKHSLMLPFIYEFIDGYSLFERLLIVTLYLNNYIMSIARTKTGVAGQSP